MIEVSGVSKSYGRLTVLQDLSLTVKRGRVMGLIGPNAAGKTTLVKIILGLAKKDSGNVAIDGIDVEKCGDYRSMIGYMPQAARFPENLSGRELMSMLTDLRDSNPELDEELVRRFDMAASLDKPVRTLSGGTRQKVNAIIAFLFRPELLIMDEPTAGLDPVSSAILKDKIIAERAAGKTFLLTSHIMSELEELADDIAFISDGRVAFVGELQELKKITRQSNLERAIAEVMKRGAAA